MNPPEMNESRNWVRCNLMKKLALLEKIESSRKPDMEETQEFSVETRTQNSPIDYYGT